MMKVYSNIVFPLPGGCLIQIAEIFRNIQMQHEETVQSFHKELIVPLEQKVEQDTRSMPVRTHAKYRISGFVVNLHFSF